MNAEQNTQAGSGLTLEQALNNLLLATREMRPPASMGEAMQVGQALAESYGMVRAAVGRGQVLEVEVAELRLQLETQPAELALHIKNEEELRSKVADLTGWVEMGVILEDKYKASVKQVEVLESEIAQLKLQLETSAQDIVALKERAESAEYTVEELNAKLTAG